MIALLLALGMFALVVIGGPTDKPLTAWDALVILGIACCAAGVSDLFERHS